MRGFDSCYPCLLLTQPSNRIGRKTQRNHKRKHGVIYPVSRFLGKNLFVESLPNQKTKKWVHSLGRNWADTYTHHGLLVTRLLNLTSSKTLKQTKNVYLKRPLTLDIRRKFNLSLIFKKPKLGVLSLCFDSIQGLSTKGAFYSLTGVGLLGSEANSLSIVNRYPLVTILTTGSDVVLRRLEELNDTPLRFKKAESSHYASFPHRSIRRGLVGVRRKLGRTILPYIRSLSALKSWLNCSKKLPLPPLFNLRAYTQKLSYLYNLLQKRYIRSRFLRFFNYSISAKDFQVSTQIFVKETSRDQVNWFPYSTKKLGFNRRGALWSEQLYLFYSAYASKKEELSSSYIGTGSPELTCTSIRDNVLNRPPFSTELSNYVFTVQGEGNYMPHYHTRLINKSSSITNFVMGEGRERAQIFSKNSLNIRFFHGMSGNPLFYKYIELFYSNNSLHLNSTRGFKASKLVFTSMGGGFFESRSSKITQSSLVPMFYLSQRVKKRFINFMLSLPFSLNVTMWYHTMLVRFVENCSGFKASLMFNPFLENSLTFVDTARCYLWTDRVFDFRRLLGPKVFIRESFKIFHLSFRLKDPTFLSSWIREMLKRTSFWKYRVIFRYIKHIVRYLFSTIFSELQFKGMKLKLKGKISVGGNSRARTLMYRIGETSQSTFNHKVTHDINLVHSFTGVMGFQLWFYF